MFGFFRKQSSPFHTIITVAVLFHAHVRVMDGLECPPSKFSDIPSRVVLSEVIVEGKVLHTAVQGSVLSNSTVWATEFTVNTVHKGELFKQKDQDLRSIKDTKYQDELLDPFQMKITVLMTDEVHRCTLEMKFGQSYIVFLANVEMKSRRSHDYWASSSPTLSTTKSIRYVKKYGCKICAELPKVEISSEKIFWRTGEEIQLKCSVGGSPPPRVTWFKNDEVIETIKRYSIISRRSSSLLRIEEATETDGGLFTCSAENVLGAAQSISQPISIEPEPMMIQSDDALANSKMCDDQTYCVNGGVCYVLTNVDTKYCVCPEGYTGKRCQDKGPELGIGGMEDILVIICIFLMLLLLITTFAILYCLAKFRHDFSENEKRYLAIVRGRTASPRLRSVDHHGDRTSDILESLEKLLPDRGGRGLPSGIAEPVSATRLLSCQETNAEPVRAFQETAAAPPSLSNESNSVDKDERFDNIASESPSRYARKLEETDSNSKNSGPGLESKSSHHHLHSPKEHGRLGDDACLKGKSVPSETSSRINDQPRSPVSNKDIFGSESVSTSGQEKLFDDVNALLLELGVCDDFERKKNLNQHEPGVHF